MPRITDEMIHPELRKKARALRLLPGGAPSVRSAKVINFLCRSMRGKHRRTLGYEQLFLPRADGSKLRVCRYSPLQPGKGVAGLLWIHGGGYSVGTAEQAEFFAEKFIGATNCVVFSPDYTLSVDKPYPAALEDCYLALLWLRDNVARYGVRDDQIFVGGDSSGGGLAAALALYARDKGEVSVAFQMPLYPMIDDRPTPSSTENDAPMWDTRKNDAAWKLYLGELYGSAAVPSYAAAARETDCRGLPPLHSFVGSIEPFCDETVAYANRLRKAGIPAEVRVFEGAFHAFDGVCPKTAIAQEASAFMVEGFVRATKHYFAAQPAGADVPVAPAGVDVPAAAPPAPAPPAAPQPEEGASR